MKKRILLIVIAVLALAQFAQPDRSSPPLDRAQDMLEMTAAPPSIKTLVTGACYDCHSNATNYPWYAYITPVNFWLQHHIDEGREVLNFSSWDQFVDTEAAKECGESITENEMPPKNYGFIHDHGRLSQTERDDLIAWFNTNLGTEEYGEEEEED